MEDEVTYDKQGRMNFNPAYHSRHNKPYTTDEYIYIAKFYEIDSQENIAAAIGRTGKTLASVVWNMKKTGVWDHYKNIPDDVWEAIK